MSESLSVGQCRPADDGWPWQPTSRLTCLLVGRNIPTRMPQPCPYRRGTSAERDVAEQIRQRLLSDVSTMVVRLGETGDLARQEEAFASSVRLRRVTDPRVWLGFAEWDADQLLAWAASNVETLSQQTSDAAR